jgi:acetyl-CoA carboxylase biotin carboxyl carrier protein
MEYEKIKQLMEDMGNSKLTSIDIDFPDGTKISMKKEEKEIIKTVENQVFQVKEKNEVISEKTEEKNEVEENFKIVKSPMVGTFYLKPSPDSNPYVEVGKKVKKGDVLCIIEAMKLMNEIESEFDGEIAEILLKDGEIVEYGKPLFKIK